MPSKSIKFYFFFQASSIFLMAAFYILRHTARAACLTENGFMDCVRSCDILLSDEGKAAIVQLHVDGIKAYVDSLNQD